jgi:hypothetical protein
MTFRKPYLSFQTSVDGEYKIILTLFLNEDR